MDMSFTALCAQEHKRLAFLQDDNYGFAKQALTVPISLNELPLIVRQYPVLFMDDKAPHPVAVLGLNGKDNTFVDTAGRWLRDSYIPAIIQLHPFALHEIPGRDEGILLFDHSSRRLSIDGSARGSNRLFGEVGEPTEFLRKVVGAQLQFYEGRQKAIEFGSLLSEAGVLMRSQIMLSQQTEEGGTSSALLTINERAYRALAPKLIDNWFRDGWLDSASLVLQSQKVWMQWLASRQPVNNGMGA